MPSISSPETFSSMDEAAADRDGSSGSCANRMRLSTLGGLFSPQKSNFHARFYDRQLITLFVA